MTDASTVEPIRVCKPTSSHISRWEFSETAICPRCDDLTHPEYLRANKDGYVVGCSSCCKPIQIPTGAVTVQV